MKLRVTVQQEKPKDSITSSSYNFEDVYEQTMDTDEPEVITESVIMAFNKMVAPTKP